MAGNMMMLSLNMVEEEENTGPSVDSEDMEERIAARRMRIEKRVEAQRRAAAGEDLDDQKVVIELNKSRKQIEVSRQRITKLTRDGNEFLTNIRVAGDARDACRRTEDEEIKRHRRERIENEAKTALDRFDEITKKWDTALQKEIPQDLHEMLQQQKEACNNMVEEKNKLINDLQLELKAKDDLYVKDLKKQAEDIDLMIERMDEQVRTMTTTYREELTQIEKAFIAQRDDLMEQQSSQWEMMMQAIRDKQNDYLDARQKRVDDFEQQLQDLRVQHAEEYNALKIKLETDVQILEQQLQMMKATYQLNLEKLEYNFQVLKKRDEENTITKSQQKRKITRLQDVLNNLKIKLQKQEKQFRAENEQLTEDFKRVTEQFRDLQKKSKNLLAADSKKFQDIWLMNEEELKGLGCKLAEADRIIHEQQMGLNYQMPDLSFMENCGPIMSKQDRHRSIPATQVVQEIMAHSDGGKTEPDLEAMREGGINVRNLGPTTVKAILDLLCIESGFLIEDKLQRLLQPLDKDEQSLMRLDAVFSALGITTEEDINQLLPYFIDLIQADRPPVEEEIDSERSDTTDLDTKTESTPFTGPGESMVVEAGPSETITETTTMESEKKEEAGEAESKVAPTTHGDEGDAAEAPETEQETDPRGIIELIHPTDVTKALRVFVEDFYRSERERQSRAAAAHFTLAALDDRDDSDDAAYWQMYSRGIVDPKKELVWDALLQAMEKYSACLTYRSSLITDVDALKVQNAELRHLLQQYVGSKVNYELEVPPTQVMQMDRF